ncbi:MAG: hypothetical protein ACYTFY_12905 [Planctomycetota bacterium]|jgi:hypothetical protein
MRGQAPLGKIPELQAAHPDSCEIEIKGYGFYVRKGFLAEGDTVTLTADEFDWTPLSGRKEFKVTIKDEDNTPERRLPQPIVIEILPDKISRLECTLPCTFKNENEITAQVTARDKYDNRVPCSEEVIVATGDAEEKMILNGGIGKTSVKANSNAQQIQDTAQSQITLYQLTTCRPLLEIFTAMTLPVKRRATVMKSTAGQLRTADLILFLLFPSSMGGSIMKPGP